MNEEVTRNKRIVRNNKCLGTVLILGLLLFAACAIAFKVDSASAVSPTTVPLGRAATFSVLAGSGITNTGPTTITGDVGTFPTLSETGFGSITLHGTNHVGDTVTQGAKDDLVTAYNDAAGRTPVSTVSTELGGTTLTPGVYNSAAGTFGITGTLTLDGGGDPNAVFIFKAASTLITAADNSVVSLTNGTHVCNVFWQVGSSATIGTWSTFVGNILALESITVNTGATVDGRVLARNGAVTLDSNTIGQTVHLEGIVLAPASSTNPVGASHTVTATVAGTGDPVVGRSVTFRVVSGPNAGVTSSVLTNSSGHASFIYMSILSGTDTIEASFVNSQGATVTSNQVTKTWTGVVSGIVLAPAFSTNRPGASHTVTATVADTGNPVVGRSVTFRVVSGPNAGLTSSVLTGSSGHASFTYVSSSLGTDTIEASFVNSQGATVTSNQVTKTWTSDSPPPTGESPPRPVGGEIRPIDTLSVLSVLLSQYSAVLVLLIVLLVPLGFLLVEKRKRCKA